MFLVDPGQEAGDVDQRDEWDVKRVTRADESRRLFGRVDVEHTGQHHRLVSHYPDDPPVEPGQDAHDVAGPVRLHLQVLAVVHDLLDDGADVVRRPLVRRHDPQKLLTPTVRAVGRFDRGRGLVVVRRQEGKQVTDLVQAGFLVVGEKTRHAGALGVDLRSAQLGLGHFLTGHRTHDVRSGNEHVRGVAGHEDEVRQRRGVHRATGAGTKNDTDLGNDPGETDVAREKPSEAGERRDALLYPRTASVVETDDRRADRLGQVQHLVDLCRKRLTERSAANPGVMGEDNHTPTVYRTESGNHPVARRVRTFHSEAGGAVLGEEVEFGEGVRIQEVFDALTGGEFAAGVVSPGGFRVVSLLGEQPPLCKDRGVLLERHLLGFSDCLRRGAPGRRVDRPPTFLIRDKMVGKSPVLRGFDSASFAIQTVAQD